MIPTKVPYLCGGILFSLILQARKTRTKARDKLYGGSDGLKDTDVMMGLVKVVTGDCFTSSQGNTFAKCTTQFKTCQDYGTTYIPFTDSSVVSTFNSSVKQKDPDLLKRMSEFINKYINELRSEWLVKALFEVIQNDNEIDPNTPFAVSSKIETAKKDLDNITEVELPIFLIAVFSFILNERKENSKGRSTFETWHTQSGPKAPWKYKANVGATIERSVTVKINCEPNEPALITANISDSLVSEVPKQSATDRINDKILASGQALADACGKAMENLADEMDEKSSPPNDEADSQEHKEEVTTTIIQQQTNVVQNGDNNINLTNNGTINIKL